MAPIRNPPLSWARRMRQNAARKALCPASPIAIAGPRSHANPKSRSVDMEFRQLGGSGFKVPALSMGTGTFGGGNDFFRAWGDTDAKGATRLIDICLDAGL